GRPVSVRIFLAHPGSPSPGCGSPRSTGGPMYQEAGRPPIRGRRHPIERVHIELLDGFACYAQGAAVDLAPSAQRLLAFVAVHGGRVGRGIVISALWPDRDDKRGSGNLRSVIWRLPEPVRSSVCLHNGEVSLADVSCDLASLISRAHRLTDGT